MEKIKNYFLNQLELLKKYLSDTSILVIILSFGKYIVSFFVLLYEYLQDNLIGVILIFVLVVLYHSYIIYIKKNYIKTSNFSLEDDTFLINTIFSVLTINKLKKSQNINNVHVTNLVVSYNIGEEINDKSNLDLKWYVEGHNLNEDLYQYDFMCTKSESKRKFIPIIKMNNKDMVFDFDFNNCLFNHVCIRFPEGKLGKNQNFELNISLNNYFQFYKKECEVLVINPYRYGNSVDNLKIIIEFQNPNIESCNLEVYRVNIINFNRKKIFSSSKKIKKIRINMN